MYKFRQIRPGDPALPVILERGDGRKVNLGHQSRAGRATVLAFGTSGVLARLAAPMEQALDALSAAGGALYAIASDGEPGNPDAFVDPEATLARRLTGAPETIAVISPSGRLAAVFPLDEITAAMRLAEDLHRRTPERCVVMQAPVLLIDQVLEPELCAEALACWEAGRKTANAVSRGSGQDGAAGGAKRRTDVIISDGQLFEKLKERLEHRVLPEMYKVFRTRIASMEALRIGCYDSADLGAFERHRDNTTPQTAHRGFAISLNLVEKYEGGAVRFPEYDGAAFTPEPGAALIFSCALLHEALPVTKGRRFAMFSFLNDAEGAASEQRRHQQRQPAKARPLPGPGG